ncbi:MAG: TetR/AcrR family transcriptional regulator [Qingshengfaniella sp.]
MIKEKSVRVRGPGRTSREDWLNVAMTTLVTEGVDQVKVLNLSRKLDCARSSFYWYFKNRTELLNALIEVWARTNTKVLVEAASAPAPSIGMALGNLLAVWVSPKNFDTKLDFAIRDWARRDPSVRRALDQSEGARLEAIAGMFRRHDYSYSEADVRAQIVYFTQIGYHVQDPLEARETRIARARDYLYCLTGQHPTDLEVEALSVKAFESLQGT